MRSRVRPAFTLVEILIVVVILGILAGIVVPLLANATGDAQATATYNELQKLRRTVGLWRVRHGDLMPPVVSSVDGMIAWGGPTGTEGIVGNAEEYLLSPPVNAWVGGVNSRAVVVAPDAPPDTTYHRDYAWIFDSTSGQVWAGAFDGDDHPLPRP